MGTSGELVDRRGADQQTTIAGSEERAMPASNPSAAAGGILRRGLGFPSGLFALSAGIPEALNAIFCPCSLPSKLLQFLLGADELHRAVMEQDEPTAWIVIVECEQLRPAVLVPARFRFEEKDHVIR